MLCEDLVGELPQTEAEEGYVLVAVQRGPWGALDFFLVILPLVSQPIPLSPPPMIHGTIPSRAVA